ncbi:MAG TPA: phosphoenolpyruvate--protein phosphotransferase [Thermodesulfobacteriota bacterium]|nr:phosphoenolpyruvate--protein phosphotransferase [Thermodesulfobacteriota bacterium]
MQNIKSIDRSDFHLKVVQEIGDLINRTSGLNNILEQVVNKIGDALHFDIVSVYLWDTESEKLILKATRGLNVDPNNPITLKASEGLTGYVFTSKRPLIAMPASEHPYYKYFPEIGEEEYESYIGLPIQLQNKFMGVLVGQTNERRLIHPSEESLFQIIASRLAALLEVADNLERLKPASSKKKKVRMTLQGKGVSSGFAVGNVYIFKGMYDQYRPDDVNKGTAEQESQKIIDAFINVENDLNFLIKDLKNQHFLSDSEIGIFETHLMILGDSGFKNKILDRITKKKASAERALIDTIEEVARHFESLTDIYFKERAGDFRDIGQRVLHYLVQSRTNGDVSVEVKKGSILVAKDIGPSFVSMLYKNQISAIVTEKGGETSHLVILAKSLGIPAVVGIENVSDILSAGEKIIVDGKTGFVITQPGKELINQYQEKFSKYERLRDYIEKESLKTPNPDIQLKLTANIGFPVDVSLANQYNLSDVGLFRTEFAFSQFEKWPELKEQVDVYDRVAENFSGYITVRTLDVGADKLLPYLKFPEEENPLLGLRAIRFSMEYLETFQDQIKAILLAGTKGHKFRILLPMVTNIWEVETAKELIEQIGDELGVNKTELPPLGMMIEVPGLIYQLEDYRHLVDFISIGTNDLIQYLLAVDRNSNEVGHLYSSYHPSIIRMLYDLFRKTEHLHMEISLCGEIAGSLAGSLILLSLGYRVLSISPTRAPVIRYLVNNIDRDLLEEIKKHILFEKKEKEIKTYLNEVIEKIYPSLSELY